MQRQCRRLDRWWAFQKVWLMTMSCGHVMPSWSIMSGWSSGQVSRNDGTSVAGLDRLTGLLIALVWLMVHCFLWLLHPCWMARIIIKEMVIMLLKVWSFVMMLHGLHRSKWGGQVAFTIIKYGLTVRYIWLGISILIRRSSYLEIQRFQSPQWWFQPSRKVTTAVWVRKSDSLIPSLQRFESRASTA